MVVLKYFPYAGANGATFFTEWVRVPEANQIFQVAIISHGRISTTAGTLTLQTSWDTSTATSIGTPFALSTAAPSNNIHDITSGMGPAIRAAFSFTADSAGTITVILTPKNQ